MRWWFGLLVSAGVWAQTGIPLEIEVRSQPGNGWLDDATVEAFPLGPRGDRPAPGRTLECRTQSGRCTFQVPPWVFRITVRKSGYYDPADVLSSEVVEYIKVESLRPNRMRFELLEAGAISGTVYSEEGAPVRGAILRARRADPEPGRLPLQLWTISQLNGEFSLDNLPPGRYGVSIVPPETLRRQGLRRSPITGEYTGFAFQVYHPGVEEMTWITPVEITPGLRLPHRTVVLRRMRVYALEGALVHANNDEPLTEARVGLRTADEFHSDIFQPQAVEPDGRFHFPSLAPGDYELLVFRPGLELPWIVPVQVRESGMAPILLRVPEWQTLTVRTEGPDAGLARWLVELEGWNSVALPYLAERDQVVIRGLPPGHYTLRVETKEESYLAFARQGPVDVLSQGFDIREFAPAPITARLGMGTGSLYGWLIDDKGNHLSRGWVVVAPEDEGLRLRGDRTRVAWAGVEGRFEVEGLPPGRYQIFGLAARPRGELHSPAFWNRIGRAGLFLELQPRQRIPLELPVVEWTP
jgi:hypothetical protein